MHLGTQDKAVTLSTGSALPTPLRSVPKHLQAFPWPRANTGRAQHPARRNDDHETTFTAGTSQSPIPWNPAQHNPGELWPECHPNSTTPGSTKPCVSYTTHQANPSPPSAPVGLLPDLLQFDPGGYLSRPLPVDVGRRNTRTTRRIPTKLQEEKGLSGRRADVVRHPQEAVIFREVSGKPENRHQPH